MSALSSADQSSAGTACSLHTRTAFDLTVHASYQIAFALFGPNGERLWAGNDWNPEFLYPYPAADVPGAVFTIKHGLHRAVWLNTLFDMEGRHIQYAYFVYDVMVTTIDLTFVPLGSSTKVSVVYQRTALDPAANEEVQEFELADRAKGADWEKAIDAYLAHP